MKKWQEVTEVHKRDCRETLQMLNVPESIIKSIEQRIDLAAMEAAHEAEEAQMLLWMDRTLPGVLHRGKTTD